MADESPSFSLEALATLNTPRPDSMGLRQHPLPTVGVLAEGGSDFRVPGLLVSRFSFECLVPWLRCYPEEPAQASLSLSYLLSPPFLPVFSDIY